MVLELGMVYGTQHALELGNACGRPMMFDFTGGQLGLSFY